jgi:hypothetical protein
MFQTDTNYLPQEHVTILIFALFGLVEFLAAYPKVPGSIPDSSNFTVN